MGFFSNAALSIAHYPYFSWIFSYTFKRTCWVTAFNASINELEMINLHLSPLSMTSNDLKIYLERVIACLISKAVLSCLSI